jgi:hypothetical protein
MPALILGPAFTSTSTEEERSRRGKDPDVGCSMGWILVVSMKVRKGEERR